MLSWRRAGSGFRTTGHAVYYALMGSLCVGFIVMGVVSFAGRDRATYWGTFTETSTICEPGLRQSCTVTGRWISDDRTIVKDGITLDGFIERGQTTRASYQPGGPMGDDDNNIVHTASWSGAGLWFPWVAALMGAAVLWYQHRRWRRDGEGRRYRGRHAEPVTPAADGRSYR